MLKTPKLRNSDPIVSAISSARKKDSSVKVLGEGLIQINHFSLDILIWGSNAPEFYMSWPDFPKGSPPSFGVVDSPEQFMQLFKRQLDEDERVFCVGFTHIEKDPSNAGKGGGWRWHKWGPYLGTGEPTTEYLDDEPGFKDGVYAFHIHQIAGPEKTFRGCP